MFYSIFVFIFTIIILLCYWIVVLSRENDQPDWFEKLQNTKVGTAIIFIALVIVLLSTFLSFSPDIFWYAPFNG